MTALWTSRDLVEATGGRLDAQVAASGVSIDTRTLNPGDLFIALAGENGDGHAHVATAFAKGAAAAMVHADVPYGPLLRVDDTLAALARLGAYARSRFSGHVVAVTGSVGKTTTKEMLRLILAAHGPTHAAVASYNNQWGLPLTLARTPPGAAFCIAEIGMNHAGEIEPLARLARPHVAVITAIEKAHIGHLGSIEAIADEKASIFRGLEPHGTAVLPADSPMLGRLVQAAGHAKLVTFGASTQADARLLSPEQFQADCIGLKRSNTGRPVGRPVLSLGSARGRPTNPARMPVGGSAGWYKCLSRAGFTRSDVSASRDPALNAEADGTAALLLVAGDTIFLRLAAPGRHMVMNALAAITTASALGALPQQAAAALTGFAPMAGRGLRRTIAVPGGQAVLLDESYNGNGASMRAALSVLGMLPAKRRIAVLGDMLELGAEGPAEHAALADSVAASADLLFCCGPLMRNLFDAVPERIRATHVADAGKMAALLPAVIRAGDAILVKGSLGTRMKQVVAALDRLAETA